ncbi:MAG: hypothetical protein KJP23_14960 [Deltaproteobacteria bacterium]|nr:hypothetical protein [Deltaproteobacteria bacterium]
MVIGDGIDEEARAFGLFGGKAGSINEMEFIFPGNRRYKPQSKELVPDIPKGTVLRQVAGAREVMATLFSDRGRKSPRRYAMVCYPSRRHARIMGFCPNLKP